MVNKEYVILNLLSLYQDLTGEDTVLLDELEKAFQALISILEENEEEIDIDFSFEEALNSVLELDGEAFEIFGDYLTIEEDIEDIYDNLLSNIEPTYFDEYLEDYLENIAIYDAFNIPIPLEDTKHFFNINKEIMRLYLLIADAEYKQDKRIFILIAKLRFLINKFKDMFKNIDEDMLNKLKVCISYYNSNASNLMVPFENSSWKIVLFDNDTAKMAKVLYEKTEYYYNVANYEFISQDKMEEVNDQNLSVLAYYLTHFMILLNNYIKNEPKSTVKEALNKIKYLLLSQPELEHLELYFLNNITIDDYVCPQKELDDTSLNILHKKVMECVLDLDYEDKLIKNNPSLYKDLIIRALFIKCYLDLNVNNSLSKEVIDTILTSKYYKESNHTIIGKLINDILRFVKNKFLWYYKHTEKTRNFKFFKNFEIMC